VSPAPTWKDQPGILRPRNTGQTAVGGGITHPPVPKRSEVPTGQAQTGATELKMLTPQPPSLALARNPLPPGQAVSTTAEVLGRVPSVPNLLPLASRPQASDAQEKVHAARSLSPRGRRMSPRSRRRPSDEGPVWQSLAPAKSLPSLTVAGAPALASQKEAQLPNLWPSHLGIAPPALSSDSRSRGGVISGSAVRLHSSSQVGGPPLASVGRLGHFQNQKGNSFLVTGFPPPV